MQKFSVLEHTEEWRVLGGSKHSQVAIMTIEPGDKEGDSENFHEGDQWLFVISGAGSVWANGKETNIAKGDLVLIEALEKHQVKATGKAPLITFNIYAPKVY